MAENVDKFAIDFAKLSTDEKAWDSLQRQLVDNLVDLESPHLTRKMFSFLRKPKQVACLVGAVTRREGSSVSIVEELSSADVDKGTVVHFKWRREPNEYSATGETKFTLPFSQVDRQDEHELAAMKRSYKVMSMLCGLTHKTIPGAPVESFHASQKQVEEPSRECLEFCRAAGPAIVAYLFDAFHPASKCSPYHVCKLLDIMMRYHSEVILQSLLENKKPFKSALEAMMQYVHYAGVPDAFLMLVCPVARSQRDIQSGFYTPSVKTRDQYFRALAGMNIMQCVAEHIWIEDAPEIHKSAAAELLRNLIEKYAGMPGGSDILSSLVRSPEILDGLLSVACNEEESFRAKKKTSGGSADVADEWQINLGGGSSKKKSGGKGKGGKKKGGNKKNKQGAGNKPNQQAQASTSESQTATEEPEPERHTMQRDAALDTLRLIIDLSTKEQVPSTEPREYTTFADTLNNLVECQLKPVSERLHNILDANFETLCRTMSNPSGFVSKELGKDVKHSIYVVEHPFSSYRLELIKLVIACVTHKPKTLMPKVSQDMWQSLARWFFQYPHCNLYHCEFKELFFTLLRTGDASQPALYFVLNECGFLAGMEAHFTDPQRKKRENLSGHILMMANAIRLQAQAVPQHHELNQFLNSSQVWDRFLPVLVEETLKLVEPWPASDGAALMSSNMAYQKTKEKEIAKLLEPDTPTGTEGIDLGSEFADKLGFADVHKHKHGSKESGGAAHRKSRR